MCWPGDHAILTVGPSPSRSVSADASRSTGEPSHQLLPNSQACEQRNNYYCSRPLSSGVLCYTVIDRANTLNAHFPFWKWGHVLTSGSMCHLGGLTWWAVGTAALT